MDVIVPPAACTIATVSRLSASLTSQPTTNAPSRANASAAARPCPPAVPVMSATFPSRRPMARGYCRDSPSAVVVPAGSTGGGRACARSSVRRWRWPSPRRTLLKGAATALRQAPWGARSGTGGPPRRLRPRHAAPLRPGRARHAEPAGQPGVRGPRGHLPDAPALPPAGAGLRPRRPGRHGARVRQPPGSAGGRAGRSHPRTDDRVKVTATLVNHARVFPYMCR